VGRWQLRQGCKPIARLAKKQLARYHIAQFIAQRARAGLPATEDEVRLHVRTALENGIAMNDKTIRLILDKVAHAPDQVHWVPLAESGQQTFFFL
jgi:hypothetical protein